MTPLARRSPVIAALAVVSLCASAIPLTAQIQNPITAAREAFRRAQEEAKRKQEEEARQRQGQTAPATPTSPAVQAGQSASPAVQQTGPAATTIGPQETARLAAAVAYLDIAGLKLGAPLNTVEGVLKSIHPGFKFLPQVEAVWPVDRSGTEINPPATAPKSTRHLTATFIEGRTTEEWGIQFAEHPNPAVVIIINRSLGFPNGTGPSLDSVVEGLRKKYGPESATNASAMIPNSSQRAFVARWYFDERGQALRGNLANQIFGTCNGVGYSPSNVGLCGTLTVLNANVQAAGNGVVHSMIVNVKNAPLEWTAQETTNAYLRQVEEERAKRQQKDSTQRGVPKL